MASPAASRWTFDPRRSRLGFSIKHLLVSRTRGAFKAWSGTVDVDPDQRATVEVKVDSASLDSGDSLRDSALRGPDLLDPAGFPHLTFSASGVKAQGRRFAVAGTLTIKKTSRPVTLDVEALDSLDALDRAGSLRFKASAKLKWKEFGLAWTGLLAPGGMLVGDVLDVEIEAVLVRAAASG